MKKLLAIMLIAVITATLSSCVKCVKTDNNIEDYDADVEKYAAGLFMPNLYDIGEYTEISYFSRRDESLFPEFSLQLIVSYDEENYLKEKKRLETAYTYLDEPQTIEIGDGTYYTIPIEAFSIAGFDFKIAKFDNTSYPKNFGMIGVSDKKCQIAYLWINSLDLDYICETDANEIKEMNDFIEQHFSLE